MDPRVSPAGDRALGQRLRPSDGHWHYRVQLFGTVGLQFPIMLHVTVAPVESFGHGIVGLHACVHT